MKTKLSIIIPCYNAEPYIFELLDRLAPQITPEIEVIVIDDGSKKPLEVKYDWCQVIRQDNAGASAARNTGLDHATGDYIAFIDADDLVSDNYIQTILTKAKTEEFDYCYMSWKSFGGWDLDVKLNSIEDRFPEYNLCVWNRVYKRSMIGKVRFNTKKLVAEDAQFIREVNETGKKKAFIADYMYFYRSNAANSLTKRAGDGKLPVKRIVYYYPHVTPEMTFLLDEFREEDEDAEIILMTDNNEIPELSDYAMVIKPKFIKGTELRGQRTPLFYKLETPRQTQICLYIDTLYKIGGIETWTFNFCKAMSKYYDILILAKNIDAAQMARLLPFAEITQDFNRPIYCDTAINCRYVLELPQNVEYKKYIQVVHTCKMRPEWTIKDQADKVIYVSQVAADTFGDSEAKVIHNLTAPQKPNKALLLVSATRLSYEKGGQRMIQFARMLEKHNIDYTWLVFTDEKINDLPAGMVLKAPTLNIAPYIKAADFVCQFSDQEAYGYTIVEAWENGTPTITTALPVLPEIGFVEGKHGFTIPFNVEECENLEEKLFKEYKPFEYRVNNAKIIKQWRELLGNTKPTKKRQPKKGFKWCCALRDFDDMHEKRKILAGEVYLVPEKRAEEGARQGFFRII